MGGGDPGLLSRRPCAGPGRTALVNLNRRSLVKRWPNAGGQKPEKAARWAKTHRPSAAISEPEIWRGVGAQHQIRPGGGTGTGIQVPWNPAPVTGWPSRAARGAAPGEVTRTPGRVYSVNYANADSSDEFRGMDYPMKYCISAARPTRRSSTGELVRRPRLVTEPVT